MGVMLQPWVPAILVFIAVSFGTVAAVLIVETIGSALRRRAIVRRLASGGLEAVLGDIGGGGSLLNARPGQVSQMQQTLQRMPHFRTLPLLLKQAGVTWSPQGYLLAAVGGAVAFGLLLKMATGMLFLGMLGAVGGSLIPYVDLQRRKRSRLNAFEERFPETIDLLGRAIRAGHPLSAGVQMAADEGPEPVAGEFRQVFEQQRFGLPFDDALLAMADRIEVVDVRIFVTAVLIQREVGGNLAEILDKLSQTIRARFTIRRQIKVYTAQGRLTGYVLAALPIALGFAIYFIDREYMMTLFTHWLGKWMIGAAVVLQLIGYFWIRKVVTIEI